MRIAKSKLAWIIVGTAVVASAAVIIGLNLIPPEKRLDRKLTQLGPAIVPGNRIKSLHNGDEIFPEMLAAIRAAERSITFETYICWSGDIGRTFAEALAERARAGVRVHVLLDWVGSSKMEQALLDLMKASGVEIESYRPLHWYHIIRLNNRTHRKVLVVDGRVSFTGGVGIADQWNGHAQDPDHWRDDHFLFEGPAVAQAQAVFMDNWIKTTGTVLLGEANFPQLTAMGNVAAQMFSSSPTGGSESMHLMYLMAIASAERSINLAASYFVPDELTLRALLAALARGVAVRIIVPGKYIDADSVRMASRAQWGPLLEAGALIYEYAPTMYHCKVMIVDGLLV